VIELNGGAAWFDARGLRATVSVSETDYAVAFKPSMAQSAA
jgi:hypothetical protein